MRAVGVSCVRRRSVVRHRQGVSAVDKVRPRQAVAAEHGGELFDPDSDVDLDFRVKFHDRIVVVPQGGGVRDVNITVTPK